MNRLFNKIVCLIKGHDIELTNASIKYSADLLDIPVLLSWCKRCHTSSWVVKPLSPPLHPMCRCAMEPL